MPPPRGLVQRLDQELHESGLLAPKARLLVAVSGGADSVALLRLLLAINGSDHWNWTLAVAHVDHGIRGRASAVDARFVRDLAGELELPFILRSLKLSADSSEDVARQGRLAALYKMATGRVRGKSAFDAVVTAHHADDQAETIVMRIMRGTGIEGLAGIASDTTVGGLRLLRPLLEIRRQELHGYLREIAQDWREDKTNASTRYLRNRMRQTVMPMLDVIWPRGVAALGRLGQLAAEAQQALDAEVDRRLKAAPPRAGKTAIVVSREMLRSAPPAIGSEILRRAIETAGGSCQSADFERIREVLRIARTRLGGKRVEIGNGITVEFAGDSVRIPRAFRGKQERR